MIYKAMFMSKRKFNDMLIVEPNMVAISIVAPDESPSSLDRQFTAVLKLDFHDVSEESFNVMVGSIPDTSSTDSKLIMNGKVLPDYKHAQAIIKFLKKYSQDENYYTLIVHCKGGISRSAAVIKFAMSKLEGMLVDGDTSLANPRLLRLLNKAWDEDLDNR